MSSPFGKIKKFYTTTDFRSADGRISVIADMLRVNALQAIWLAQSGHIGASFSAMDILAVLYHRFMSKNDVFILSKGHASAGLYAVLASKGYFPTDDLATFRQHNGLPGHVDSSVRGVSASTGSLGMGISKAKGYAISNRVRRVFVMVGDGELQEGQNWEAIQHAGHLKLSNLTIIVDANGYQTDMQTSQISNMHPLQPKFEKFGFDTITINGHDHNEIKYALSHREPNSKKPRVIVAYTTKGKGVRMFESDMLGKNDVYRWHGAVKNYNDYKKAFVELTSGIVGIRAIRMLPDVEPDKPIFGKSLKDAYSTKLLSLGLNPDVYVLDADLSEDNGLREFERRHPTRFIQCGIAEQDMVSTAGGLALVRKIPIVNTYTAFLASRANEQIFNNCCENKRVIYVGHLAGILPSKPGKSHQGVRDISLLRTMPNLTICTPCNEEELRQMMDYMVKSSRSSYMRLEHSAPFTDVQLPKGYKLREGQGTVLQEGDGKVVITYGALMTSYVVRKYTGGNVKIITMPFLNNLDYNWLKKEIGGREVLCYENHHGLGGLSDELRRMDFKVLTLGVKKYGVCGTVDETFSECMQVF